MRDRLATRIGGTGETAQLSEQLLAVVRETMQPERHPAGQAHRLEPLRQVPTKPIPG
jgi:hypothetical protein